MLIRQRELDPLALMAVRGGSIAAAQSVTGDLLRSVEAHTRPGFEARASWVAVVTDGDAVDTVEWNPTTPIPAGALWLRCSAYTTRTEPEA